jgi:YbgC/YbaW family acyl-CoA thioester hydrolase
MVRRSVPRVFRFRAPVWQADVDAFGELRTATLVRFLQETATRASNDAGFDPAYYLGTGSLWLVRRTMLTRFAPAAYGDELEGRTWVADFRRVRSQRDYEVRAGERLVARASTDWVFVDRTSGQPKRVPKEIEEAFQAEGTVPATRNPFPSPPEPAHATRVTRRVELHDLDALAHVNNATYLHYVEQGAEDACATLAWPLEAQLAAGGRFRPVAHDIEYRDAALYGDTIDVVTWPVVVRAHEVERQTILRRHASADVLVRVASRYAWTTLAGDETALPAALRDALSNAT